VFNVIIAFVLSLGFLLVITPVLWVNLTFKKQIKSKIRYKFLRFFLSYVRWAFRIKVHVEGLENIPKEGPLMICGNHEVNYDPLLLITLLKEPMSFLSKKELKNVIYVGAFIQIMDGIFLDRADIRKSARTFKEIEENYKNIPNYRLLVFPEGTRSRNEYYAMNEYKPGAFKPAVNTHTTIQPFTHYGTFRIFGNSLHMYNHIYVKFHKPIPYEEYKDKSTTEIAKDLHDLNYEQLQIFEANSPMEKVDINRSKRNYQKYLKHEAKIERKKKK
jgi:1-acyl-sn-glycerol-3-phosphate acyltransferase